MLQNNTIFYFKELEKKLKNEIFIANNAKKNGGDPKPYVEIPLAKDLSERVENLIGVNGIAERIRELLKSNTREEVSLIISKEIASGNIGNYESRIKKIDIAIRISIAILTEGVVAAPIEGISKITIDKNNDGSEYLKICYSGPIRSAGGTAQGLSILVGDYVRRINNLDKFKPNKKIIERYIEEIRLYNNHTSLQYNPNDDEIKTIIENCPICIDGDPTEEYEVEGCRNIKGLESNRVRGGMALVIVEGLILKAPKIKKYVSLLNIDNWSFLDKLISLQSLTKKIDDSKLKPKEKYLDDIIAGRPLFSHPSKPGGFRLRYGRSRNTSFAAAGINPSTMVILNEFITNGTQLKVERPGKAAAISCVDSIEGPYVRLNSGEFIQVNDFELSKRIKDKVEYIVDIGEILFNYGDFLENNHPLIPSSYCFEWWLHEYNLFFKKKIIDKKIITLLKNIDEDRAIIFAKLGIPLHPNYTYQWNDISYKDLKILSYNISKNGSIIQINKIKNINFNLLKEDINKENYCLKINMNFNGSTNIKIMIENLLVKHIFKDNYLYILDFKIFLICLGLKYKNNEFNYPSKIFE